MALERRGQPSPLGEALLVAPSPSPTPASRPRASEEGAERPAGGWLFRVFVTVFTRVSSDLALPPGTPSPPRGVGGVCAPGHFDFGSSSPPIRFHCLESHAGSAMHVGRAVARSLPVGSREKRRGS